MRNSPVRKPFAFHVTYICFASCFLFAGGLTRLGAAGTASVSVKNLTCEYRVEPLGLDARQPRLSWQLAAIDHQKRGQRETRYQILVASSRRLLQNDKGDRWDSGWVQSDQSANIVYSGNPLGSGQECFWKVRVADESGRLSDWSGLSRWTMGLMNPSDWKAKWIGVDPAAEQKRLGLPTNGVLPDPWIRKSFDLPAPPARAVIYVASVGYHELYVNGQKIGDSVLEPCATDNRLRARYVTYEIGNHLKTGRNVLALWLGASWSIFPPYQTEDKPRGPIVLAQADISSKDGRHWQIHTDDTWKTHPSPNSLLGSWNFTDYGGEQYDARKETPGWGGVDCDESSWQSCHVFDPRLTISSETVQPNKLIKEIKPIGMTDLGQGVYRVDMGVNYAGWLECRVAGQPGDRIRFEFSEREEAAMTHNMRCEYIVGASGKGTFRNHFNYEVGRWIRITGLKRKPSESDLRGWLVRTDYARTADFACGQPLLNQIYNTTLWTFENLSLGGYVVDCPQRERMGYGGDAHSTTRTALDNYDLGAFYTKWIEDWRDVQGPDGNLPYTAPTYWGGGGPAWSGFCVTLPWEVYRHYGDVRILRENFAMMRRWLAFLETKSKNDMLVRWGGTWDFLGDWLWPGATGVNGDTRETLFFNNCYWIYNLQTAARVADILGESQAADAYRQRAGAVRLAVHSAFYDSAAKTYVGSVPSCLAIALVVDLPPKELRPLVWQRLETEILVNHKGQVCAGITGGSFLLKLLLENHRNDLIYAMASQETYPGWGDMLKRGETTFCEDWECQLSCLHSSYLYIGSWFIEGIGGIRFSPEGGYQHFILEPWIDSPAGLRDVSSHYDSLYGRIATHWTRDGRELRLRVSAPPNTTADLRLREIDAQGLRESGRSIDDAPGVTVLSNSAGLTDLRLEPGDYDFRVPRAFTNPHPN